MKFSICVISMIVLLVCNTTRAQVQNALNFDGTDDKVEVAAASALIAGANQFSMSFWVKPGNTAISWPDFDGFAGFRNDQDADFYIVHLNSTSVEARFRNSAGINFDIVYNGLQVNTWQHLAFTYDGNITRLYQNSEKVDSVLATGNITNTGVSLQIGNLLYISTNFYMMGEIDEFGLWTKSLSQEEINCIYSVGINPNSPNLMLAYNFNEGVAGGNNTGLTSLLPVTGSLTGTLSNFGLTGSTSNWVSSANGGTTIDTMICDGESYIFGTNTLTQPGSYTATFPTSSGCDSASYLNLSIKEINTGISVTGITIHAILSGATYQWVDCNNNFSWVTGATGQNFTPTANGNYAAIITFEGCSDTSSCVPITTVGISEENTTTDLSIHPNPVSDRLYIDAGQNCNVINVYICDLSGRVVLEKNFTNTSGCIIEPGNLNAGMYLVDIRCEGLRKLQRIIKE